MSAESTAGAENQGMSETFGLEGLADLLEAREPEPETPDSDASGSDEDAPLKFNDLAGRLGMELDALYKLEITQAEDGTPVTIENLKDSHAKQGDLSLRELQFQEHKLKQESELMQAQRELQDLMAALPEKALKPEVLQKVRDKHERQMQLERERALEVMPEWRDEKVRLADVEGMIKHLQQYGYHENYLGTIADHRQLKYIRDNYQREKRIREALEQVRVGKPNPTTGQKPADKAPSKHSLAAVDRGNFANRLEAVFSQLD